MQRMRAPLGQERKEEEPRRPEHGIWSHARRDGRRLGHESRARVMLHRTSQPARSLVLILLPFLAGALRRLRIPETIPPNHELRIEVHYSGLAGRWTGKSVTCTWELALQGPCH